MMKLILDVDLPVNADKDDLEKMVLFMFFGHAINDDILAKFKHDELDVKDFKLC